LREQTFFSVDINRLSAQITGRGQPGPSNSPLGGEGGAIGSEFLPRRLEIRHDGLHQPRKYFPVQDVGINLLYLKVRA
jgi:hypothetical protein